MLSRSKRISQGLFDSIMKSGRSYHSPHFSLRGIHSPTSENPRIAVVVPKKVEKKAVGRNKLKRLLFSILGKHYTIIPVGYAGIFFVKKYTDEVSQEIFETEMISLIHKL